MQIERLVLPDETPSLVAGVPPHLLGGLRAYALHHEPVGGFLTAALSNNFSEAVLRADEHSLAGVRGLALYLVNALPHNCWGSPEKVEAWLAAPAVLRHERA